MFAHTRTLQQIWEAMVFNHLMHVATFGSAIGKDKFQRVISCSYDVILAFSPSVSWFLAPNRSCETMVDHAKSWS